MTVPKLKTKDISELDTKQRIIEAAVHLFAVKGFDGASIRDIASLANVNVASLNYHFKSKENLRLEIMEYVIGDFHKKISSIKGDSTSDFAIKMYEELTSDRAKCLNQFKLIIESDVHPCMTDPYPAGFEELLSHLSKELHPSVPQAERLWFVSMMFSVIVHLAVMSSTRIGSKGKARIFPDDENVNQKHITMLVESIMRDLNSRFK